MRSKRMNRLVMVLVLAAVMVASSVLSAGAALRTRIVVLPFYVEQEGMRIPGQVILVFITGEYQDLLKIIW